MVTMNTITSIVCANCAVFSLLCVLFAGYIVVSVVRNEQFRRDVLEGRPGEARFGNFMTVRGTAVTLLVAILVAGGIFSSRTALRHMLDVQKNAVLHEKESA